MNGSASKPGLLDRPLVDLVRPYMGAMGFDRRYWPSPLPTGLLPGTAMQTGLGALLGSYVAAPLLSKFIPRVNPRKARRVLGLLGGAAGLLPMVPFLMAAHKRKGWAGLYSTKGSPYPFQKASSTWRNVSSSKMKKLAFLPEADMQPLPISQSQAQILADPHMDAVEKTRALGYLDTAARGRSSGLLDNPGQKLFGAMLGAGVGYTSAALGGKVMGTLFGLPAPTQSTLSRMGMVAGLLRGAGVI